MPRKRILAKLMRKLPPKFGINKNKAYYCPYDHIVRGILIDGTAYKNTWRVLDFNFSIFRTYKIVHLNYSKRLPHPDSGNGKDFFGSDDTISADALQAIQYAGLIDDIVAGCSPAQFLQRHYRGKMEDRLATQAFDIGCAAGLCGDLALARRGLESARETTHVVANLYGPYRDHDRFLQDVEDALHMLDLGPDAFKARMGRVAHAGAAVHGFCPPSSSPS